MNIFNFFQKSRNENMKLLEFSYVLIDTRTYLFSRYQKSKNPLVLNFLKVIDWCCSWYLGQVNHYVESLRDYVSWPKRHYYRENLQKFIACELSGSDFVNQVLYPILFDKREARDLETNFYQQAKIDLDPKSFGFSQIIWNLQLILEGFNDNPTEEDKSLITEEELRKAVKLALKSMNKYFSD